MKKKYAIAAIDVIANIWTPEANRVRPKRDAFFHGKMKVKKETVKGITHEEMLRRMDAAGIERAFLAATKVGRLGHPACYHIPYDMVAKAVKTSPFVLRDTGGFPDFVDGTATDRSFPVLLNLLK